MGAIISPESITTSAHVAKLTSPKNIKYLELPENWSENSDKFINGVLSHLQRNLRCIVHRNESDLQYPVFYNPVQWDLIKANFRCKTANQFHALVFNENNSCRTFFDIDTFCLNTVTLSTLSCKKTATTKNFAIQNPSSSLSRS